MCQSFSLPQAQQASSAEGMLRISPFHHIRSSGLGLASPMRVQWMQLEQGGARVIELGAWGPLVLLKGHHGAGLTNVSESQVGWVMGPCIRSQWEGDRQRELRSA